MSFNSSVDNGFSYSWPLPTDTGSSLQETNQLTTENSCPLNSVNFNSNVPISQELHLNFDFLDATNSGNETNGSDLLGVNSNYSSALSSAHNSPNSNDFNNDHFSFHFNFPSNNPINNEAGELFRVNTNNSTYQQTNNTSNIRPTRVSRSDNYCETVAVESSAHVAQIVGKNGCKIKHLRAKFGTYIHTPANGEEPVFIIKGRREDVSQVKQEIIKAAKHFSKIKSTKMDKISNIINSQNSASTRLFIPNRFIGLVVGRNGWFVKVLQIKYGIYIETPKFDLCNYFRLYGFAENIRQATALIFQHIGNKTGITFSQKEDGDDIYFVG